MCSVVVVLGLKRGGTSVTAGIVHRLGIPMGERFPPPASANPDGFFEDVDFVSTLDRVTSGAVVADGRILRCNLDAYRQLQQLIKERSEKYELWGLKSFALNYVLPHFTAMCDPAVVRVLKVERSFAETVESLSVHLNIPPERAKNDQADCLYNTEKTYNRHPGPKMILSYRDLLANPEGKVREIAGWLGVPYKPEAAALVRSDRKHF
jgi:hypothetical protein